MPAFLIIGYKGHNVNEPPHVLYAGNDGVKANEAAAKTGGKGFVRLQRLVNPIGTPLPIPAAPITKNEIKIQHEQAQ